MELLQLLDYQIAKLLIAIMEDKLFGLDNGLVIRLLQELELLVIWFIVILMELGFLVIFNAQCERNELMIEKVFIFRCFL